MNKIDHIIVTGGAGFIGSRIALRLIKEGYKVTVLDNLSTGRKENIPEGASFIKIDLGQQSDYSRLKNIACDAVFHLAGQSSGEDSFKSPLYDLQSHVLSTFYLLDWCKQKQVSRFIYASSMSIYGDPESLPVKESHPLQPKTYYAAGKISAEAYIKFFQTLGINTTIFRFFSVYGPGQNLENKNQGMVSIFLSYMLEQVPVYVKGSEKRFRDFVYIDDVVDAWLSSYRDPAAYGKIYNLASGKKTTVEALLNALKASFDYKVYPIDYRDGTPGDQLGLVADISFITKELKWSPRIDLQAGLNSMVAFEKGNLKN